MDSGYTALDKDKDLLTVLLLYIMCGAEVIDALMD